MNKIDRNIDLNLRLIYEDKKQALYASNLINVDDVHMSRYEALEMADYLVSEGLINRDVERCTLTSFGLEVMEQFGGWKEYKLALLEQQKEQNDFLKQKEKLEFDNLQLQNENLEYQKKNRELDEEIQSLNRKNLKLSTQRFWIGIGATILGGIIGMLFL